MFIYSRMSSWLAEQTVSKDFILRYSRLSAVFFSAAPKLNMMESTVHFMYKGVEQVWHSVDNMHSVSAERFT